MVAISGQGGIGQFEVVPDELTAAANQTTSIGDRLKQLPPHASAALGAAAARGGLELGRAVADAIGSWDRAITDRATAVHDAADRLRSSAASYASTEDDTALSIRQVHRALYD